MNDITVVIPTHPERMKNGMLGRAMQSVFNQSLLPAAVHVSTDLFNSGAPDTRQRGLETVKTSWTAFLDSDDEFMPKHLKRMRRFAELSGADYVYSWYQVVGGTDPRPTLFGKPFDPDNPVQTTITILVKTELAQDIGFTTIGNLKDPQRLYAGEDWDFTQKCVKAGADIRHLPEITWFWHHHSGNSSGLPHRGDAR